MNEKFIELKLFFFFESSVSFKAYLLTDFVLTMTAGKTAPTYLTAFFNLMFLSCLQGSSHFARAILHLLLQQSWFDWDTSLSKGPAKAFAAQLLVCKLVYRNSLTKRIQIRRKVNPIFSRNQHHRALQAIINPCW